MAMGYVFFERDGVLNARTTVDVTRRDRLAPAGAHTDSAAGRVIVTVSRCAIFFTDFFVLMHFFLAREKGSGILRAP
jgi:hypothetical protein